MLSARWSKNWEPNCGKLVIQGGTESKLVVQRQFGQRKGKKRTDPLQGAPTLVGSAEGINRGNPVGSKKRVKLSQTFPHKYREVVSNSDWVTHETALTTTLGLPFNVSQVAPSAYYAHLCSDFVLFG